MIVVWGRRNSINVQKVLWALAELGLSFERHNAGGSFGGTASAEFKAMNPNGLVPVLRDGDITMFESNAIVRYLAARYGAGSLRPAEPQALALAEQWMEWTTTTIAPYAGTVFMQIVRTSPDRRNEGAIAQGVEQLRTSLPVVDAALGGPALPCRRPAELRRYSSRLLGLAAQSVRLAASFPAKSRALVHRVAIPSGLSRLGDDARRPQPRRVAGQRKVIGLTPAKDGLRWLALQDSITPSLPHKS